MLTQHMQNIGEAVSLPPMDLVSRLDVPMASTGGGMMPSTSASTPFAAQPLSTFDISTPMPRSTPNAAGAGMQSILPAQQQPLPSPHSTAFDPARIGGINSRMNKMMNVASVAESQGILNMQTNQYEMPLSAMANRQPVHAPMNVPQANPIPLSVESLSVQPEQTMHIVPKPLPLSQIPLQQQQQPPPLQHGQYFAPPPPQQQRMAAGMGNGNQAPLYGGHSMNGNGGMGGGYSHHPQGLMTPSSPIQQPRILQLPDSPPPLPLPEAPGVLNFIVYSDSIHDENILGEVILNNRCTLTDIRVAVIKELEVQGEFRMECNGSMLDSGKESSYAVHCGCRPDNIIVLKFS